MSLAEVAIVAIAAIALLFGGLMLRRNREDDSRELEAVRRRLRERARQDRVEP